MSKFRDTTGLMRWNRENRTPRAPRPKTEPPKCFRHPERPAVHRLKIPCAPGGGLWVCEECAKPESMDANFEAYLESHRKAVQVFKGETGHE